MSHTPETQETHTLTPRWHTRTSLTPTRAHTRSLLHTHACTLTHTSSPHVHTLTAPSRNFQTHCLLTLSPTHTRVHPRARLTLRLPESHACALTRPDARTPACSTHALRARSLAPSSSCTLMCTHTHAQTPSPSRTLRGQCLRPQCRPSPGFPAAPAAVTVAGLGGTPVRSAGPGSPCGFLRGLQTEGSSRSPG